MPSKKFTKICSVCGEKAIGYNFCAISCESCKAFFRRNATKLDEYNCPFDEKCKISVVTRKFCRKCRLKKCYDVGMKQEWILNEEEKELRKNKIEENRRWRQMGHKNGKNKTDRNDSISYISTDDTQTMSISQPSPADTINSDTTESTLPANDIPDDIISDDEIITNIMEIENFLTTDNTVRDNENTNNFNNDMIFMTNSSIISKSLSSTTTAITLTNNTNFDEISENTYQKLVELELTVLPIPPPISESNGFNEVECNRLMELFEATVGTHRPRPTNKVMAHTMQEVANFFLLKFEVFIERFVKMTKCLSAFQSLCSNDQLAIVKFSCLEALFLRTALYFDYNSEHWTFIMDSNNALEFKLDLLKDSPLDGIYVTFKKFLQNLRSEWDFDPFVIDLLTVIVLFNPDRPNIIHKEIVKLQQQLYMYLLQRYLRLKYVSECESKTKFVKIMNSLEYLRHLNDIHRRNQNAKNTNHLGPLLREILDLPAVSTIQNS
ncbi:nuclear hormone receptor HR96-like [Oppia nitens]|uniref:nuclear hormone receptor HR96-like n=1 Tax=Oppia nitens TaxID=1686743 RepID=UPI0023DCC44F|nr:nuclear hormone receptor HR96-like [Oppia nitens]